MAPWFGFCPRCRNKVRSDKVRLDELDEQEVWVHESKVKVRYDNGVYISEVCDGVVIPCKTYRRMQDLQDASGFRNGMDQWKRRPFVDESNTPAPKGVGFIKVGDGVGGLKFDKDGEFTGYCRESSRTGRIFKEVG